MRPAEVSGSRGSVLWYLDRRGPDDTRKPDDKHGGRYQFPNSFNGLCSRDEFPIYALMSTEGFDPGDVSCGGSRTFRWRCGLKVPFQQES